MKEVILLLYHFFIIILLLDIKGKMVEKEIEIAIGCYEWTKQLSC